MKKSPYAILLGGKHPDATLELHDIRFTLASNQPEAFANMAGQWFGDQSTAHVDAWQDLSHVDGYAFSEDGDDSKTLFFVNIGSYQKGIFNEEHRYLFLIADDLKSVKARVKGMFDKTHALSHLDNAEAVDLIIPVKKIDQQVLRWRADPKGKEATPQTGYWPLK